MSTARSRVLLNEYLLDLVFEYLWLGASDSPQNGRPRQLVGVALTCKAFLVPAMNALWKTIPTLLPLLRLIGSFVWRDNIGYGITGLITSEDLSRVHTYGRRVRTIEFGAQTRRVSPLAYPTLASLKVEFATILPALKTLSITYTNTTDLAGILFISSTVPCERIIVHGISAIDNGAVDFIEHFLLGLTSKEALLWDLSLDGPTGNGTTTRLSSALKILSHLKQLKRCKVHLPTVPATEIVGALRNLPSLKSLELSAGPSTGNEVHHHTGFTSLEAVHILSNSPSEIAALCRDLLSARNKIQHVQLETLSSSTVGNVSDATYWNGTLQFIAANQDTSLQSLRLSTRNPNVIFSDTILSPIFRLKYLRELHLDAQALSAYSGFIVSRLVVSGGGLPNLTSLVLPPLAHVATPTAQGSSASDRKHEESDSAAPDVQVLSKLGEACPKLTELSICLDIGSLTPASTAAVVDSALNASGSLTQGALSNAGELSSRTWQHQALRSLKISDARGDCDVSLVQCFLLATYLTAVFPCLREVGTYRNSMGKGFGRQKAFDEVATVMGLLREFGSQIERQRRPREVAIGEARDSVSNYVESE